MPIGVLSMLIIWVIGILQHDLNPLNFYALPAVGCLFIILILLLWREVIPFHSFELVVYGTVLAYSLCEFVWEVILCLLTGMSLSPNFTLWIPFVFILGFLILDTGRALLYSVVFSVVTLVVGASYYFYSIIHKQAAVNFSILLQFYFASVFYIAVLYLVARIKERYISEREAASDMSKLAMTDPLTQIHNRLILTRLLKDELNRVERYGSPLSVLLFDLDNFKTINDTLGHNMGDIILREVAHLLRQQIRTSDPFGRWGGDEFLCLVTNTDSSQAVELADRLRAALHRFRFTENCKVTASFGVTTYQKGDTSESLIRRADLGLYKAKGNGRDRVEVVLAGVTLPLFEGEKPYPIVDDDDELGGAVAD